MTELELMQQVEHFYSSAWDKLIILGGVIITIIGIAVPVIVQILQKRNLKLHEREIIFEVKREIETLKDQVTEELKVELATAIKELEIKVEKSKDNALATALHIQGNADFNEGRFVDATKDYLKAILLYASSDEVYYLNNLIDVLPSVCYKNISQEDLIDIFKKEDWTIKGYFKKLNLKSEKPEIKKSIQTLKYETLKFLEE